MSTSAFDQLWAYNNWANNSLFTLFDSYGQKAPANSLRLLSHIINAQLTWANRIDGVDQPVALWDTLDLDTIKRIHTQTSQSLRAALDKHDLQDTFNYSNSQGVAFENTLFDMLLQVFNHGTYHRAQIASDLKANGLTPINTDYISFVRLKGQPAPQP